MKARLTHSQFFELTEAIRNQQEVIMKTCWKPAQVTVLIAKYLNFPISQGAVDTALEMTKVQLAVKPVGINANAKKQHGNNTRVLSKYLIELYKALGQEVPQELLDLHVRTFDGVPVDGRVGDSRAPNIKAPPGIPARTLVDPKTIAVVNAKG